MPSTTAHDRRGTRRLKELQGPLPTLRDLEKTIYGPEAARSLVDLIRRPLEMAPRPLSRSDALRQMLFEGTNALTPTEALVRAATFAIEPYRVVRHAKAVLRYSVHFGTVALEEGPEGSRFVQLHPGIVHFPRLGAVADARTLVAVGKGVTLAGLLKREASKRSLVIARRRLDLLQEIVPLLKDVEPSALVPKPLQSVDHPPAEVMADGAHCWSTACERTIAIRDDWRNPKTGSRT